MSVLHIALGLIEPSTLWMRRQLDMLGDDVGYLFTDAEGVKAYKREYNCRTIWRSQNSYTNRAMHWLNLVRLYSAIHSSKTSIVFMHYATTAALYKKIIHTTRKPVFVHCHGYDVTWDGRSSGVPMHGAGYVDQIRTMPANVIFIGNSKRTIQRLLDIGIPAERIILKYLGVNVMNYFPQRVQKDKALTVLYLGRLIDFKGPDLVIKAFEKACAKGFAGKLVIAGDGPLRTTCELMKSHSAYGDRMNLLGAVDADTGKQLRDSADIFTAHNCTGPLSGQEEAFGVTMIEAMAEGLPIINAVSGSIPELLENEVNAILVESGNVEAHANAFLRMQNEPELRDTLARNAWERVRDNFTLEQECTKLREILQLSNNCGNRFAQALQTL